MTTTTFALTTWTEDNKRTAITGYRHVAIYKCDACGVSTNPKAAPDLSSAIRAALALTTSHACLRVA